MPFNAWNLILPLGDCHAVARKFENLRMVAVEQGYAAEALSGVVNKAFNSMTKIAGYVLAWWNPSHHWLRNSGTITVIL